MIKRTLSFIACLVIHIFLISVACRRPDSSEPHPGRPSPLSTRSSINILISIFKLNPTTATQTGFHQYDSQLEDFSRAGVESEVAGLEKFRKQFGAIRESRAA